MKSAPPERLRITWSGHALSLSGHEPGRTASFSR